MEAVSFHTCIIRVTPPYRNQLNQHSISSKLLIGQECDQEVVWYTQ